MNALDTWLNRATRHLSREATLQVRREIGEHYESARETAALTAATAEEADRIAIAALGDAKVANCQYRQVMLTSAEARLLREGNWEAKAVCSRGWARWLFLGLAALGLLGSAELLIKGDGYLGSAMLAGVMSVGLFFAAKVLPIDTPSRGRIFRGVRLTLLLAIWVLAFGPHTLQWSWLLFSCMWPLVWIEMRRGSIRRKLPVAQWPRHLYL
jgi:hypothetical protein